MAIMRSIVSAAVAGGALATALAGCVNINADSFSRIYSASLPERGVRTLVVKGMNGDIHASAEDVDAIEVDARIETNDLSALPHDTVAVSHNGPTAVVASVCSRAQIAFWNIQNCGVDYEIRYPRSMQLSVTNVNGDVTITGAAAAVDAATTNGDVRVRDASANVAAQSHEGDVTVSLASGWIGNAVAASTRFGNVRFTVPDGFRGRIRASTVAGDIHGLSLFSSGPASVDLSTTFGDISVERQEL